MNRLHPKAVPGAEYAPIPSGASECYTHCGFQLCGRRGFHTPDIPGPHTDPGLPGKYGPTPRVVDLLDADTALSVLRRLLATPHPPVAAYALAQTLLGGRWGQQQAESLGELCARVWAPEKSS